MHHAVEIDRHHRIPARPGKFAALVDDRALAQHQHIQPVGKRRGRVRDGIGIADIDPVIAQPGQIAAVCRVIVRCLRARAPNVHARAARPKCLGNAIADPARPADHQHAARGKVGVVDHASLSRPALVRCDQVGRDRWPKSMGHGDQRCGRPMLRPAASGLARPASADTRAATAAATAGSIATLRSAAASTCTSMCSAVAITLPSAPVIV